MRLESLYAPSSAGGSVVGADGKTYRIVDGIVTVPYVNSAALIEAGYIPVPDSEPNAAPSGGGAANFTDLVDAPSEILAHSLLMGSPDGTSVIFSPDFRLQQDSNAIMFGSVSGATDFYVFGKPNFWDGDGDAFIDLYSTISTTGIDIVAPSARFQITASTNGTTLNAYSYGLLLIGIPTSNPNIANAIWNDAGTLKISAG